MLSLGDVLGAEHKFVEIADTVRKIREQAEEHEARAIFEAGKLAEARIDWRAASAHYARAAGLQPSNWQYTQGAGRMTHAMGDYATAAHSITSSASRRNDSGIVRPMTFAVMRLIASSNFVAAL